MFLPACSDWRSRSLPAWRDSSSCSCGNCFRIKLELRGASGSGQSVSAEQPHVASDCLVRPGRFSSAESLSQPRSSARPVPVHRSQRISRTFSSSISNPIKPERWRIWSGLAAFPIIQEAPIVTMRLVEIKGRKTEEILADPQNKIPEWELQREYRSTYRETLSETEKITDGSWIGHVDYHTGRRRCRSRSTSEIANDFGAKVGDELRLRCPGRPDQNANREPARRRLETFPDQLLRRFSRWRARERAHASMCSLAVCRMRRLPRVCKARWWRNSPNVSALDLSSVIQTVDSF